MSSLLIISHTMHYKKSNEIIVGWEPTVREINFLSKIFDNIIHLAPLYDLAPHSATIEYNNEKIKFIPLIPSGGKTLLKKISIFLTIPINIYRIYKIINKTDWIHFRAPCNLGIFVLPILTLLRKRKIWIKYAGNWKQRDVPISYKFQRWWLENNFINACVTINGKWPKQKKHLITFNNPCVSKDELDHASKRINNKFDCKRLNICFVGRLETDKGFNLLADVLLQNKYKFWIDQIHFVGDGSQKEFYNKKFRESDLNINFHGLLDRKSLNVIYELSHLIILPSISEGFPKVLIEAGSYGCIPVVANINSISMYINESYKNGFLISSINIKGLEEILENIKNLKMEELLIYSRQIMEFSKKYSYENYNKNIVSKIVKKR
tara:strand:- start:250 stop:1386 length:1137 start_codon:yes stop_codon:yes gene_type:complete